MKQCKGLLLALLALICLLTSTIPVFSFATDRTYTARFYANGLYTDINDEGQSKDELIGTIVGNPIEVSDEEGNVTIPKINLLSDKYYFKGYKESGKDPESFYIEGGLLPIQEDRDYVAVYGVRGTEVEYTVQYLLEGTTTKLAEDRKFYAAIGDKPISSYIYIEGYQPYRRTTKTITGDPAQDILYVYYTRIVTPTGGGTTTTTTVTGGGGGAAVAGGAAANGGANNAANNAANNQNPNNQNPNNPQGTNNTAPAPAPTQQYAEYEDIMDLDVPLAAPNIPGVGTVSVPNAPQVIEPNQHGRIPNWMLIAGAVLLVGLISVLYWYLLFYRKKKKYASLNEDYDILDFDKDDDF